MFPEVNIDTNWGSVSICRVSQELERDGLRTNLNEDVLISEGLL